jgi:hypothetical protein
MHAIRDVFLFLLVVTGLACLASEGFEYRNARKVEILPESDGGPVGA